jgi:hypothetical protein
LHCLAMTSQFFVVLSLPFFSRTKNSLLFIEKDTHQVGYHWDIFSGGSSHQLDLHICLSWIWQRIHQLAIVWAFFLGHFPWSGDFQEGLSVLETCLVHRYLQAANKKVQDALVFLAQRRQEWRKIRRPGKSKRYPKWKKRRVCELENHHFLEVNQV